MALQKYGAAEASLTINGINIEQYGDTDPPISISDDAERSVHKDGVGGTAVVMDRVNSPKRLTINLLPGSDEARQLIALAKTKPVFTATFRQLGTGEVTVMFDGSLVNRGDQGRAGRGTVTDEVFIFRFNDSDET